MGCRWRSSWRRRAASSSHHRHGEYFLALAEEAEPLLRLERPDAAAALERLRDEHDNCRAALEWSLAYEPIEFTLRLALVLSGLWNHQGYLREALQWLVQV